MCRLEAVAVDQYRVEDDVLLIGLDPDRALEVLDGQRLVEERFLLMVSRNKVMSGSVSRILIRISASTSMGSHVN